MYTYLITGFTRALARWCYAQKVRVGFTSRPSRRLNERIFLHLNLHTEPFTITVRVDRVTVSSPDIVSISATVHPCYIRIGATRAIRFRAWRLLPFVRAHINARFADLYIFIQRPLTLHTICAHGHERLDKLR